MAESGWVPVKSRIRASIEELFRWLPEKCAMSVSTEKWSNPCEYREKEESLRVSKNYSGEYREKGPINSSTKKWKNPSEYQEKVESVRVSKIFSDEYRKSVQSVWVPKNGRIRASTG